MFQRLIKKVFGTKHDRQIKKVRPMVEQINALEPEFQKLTDTQIKERTEALAQRPPQLRNLCPRGLSPRTKKRAVACGNQTSQSRCGAPSTWP